MKPNRQWIEDWRIGENPSGELNVSKTLIGMFLDFRNTRGVEGKSKTTRNRYFSGLHAVGGYLVEQAIIDGGVDKTTDELLFENVGPDDGPLIRYENEKWQKEIDMTSRRLHQYLEGQGGRL